MKDRDFFQKIIFSLHQIFYWLGLFSTAIFPLYYKDIGFSNQKIGFLCSAIPIGALICRFIAPWFYNFFHLKTLIRIVIGSTILIYMIFMHVRSLSLYFLLSFFIGFFISIYDLYGPEWVYYHFKDKKKHLWGFNFISIWSSVAFILSPSIGTFILKTFGHKSFFYSVIFYYFVSFIFTFFLNLPLVHHIQKSIFNLKSVFKKSNISAFLILLIYFVVTSSTNTFYILLLRKRGTFLNEGFYFTANALGVFISKIAGIYLYKKDLKYKFILGIFSYTFFLQFILPWIKNPYVILMVSFIMGLGGGMIIPYIMGVILKNNRQTHRFSMSVLFGMIDLGNMIGNNFTGFLTTFFKIPFILSFISIFYLISCIIILKEKDNFSLLKKHV